MQTTGLIFGVVVAAWLAYLVPWYLSHRDQTPADETDGNEGFAPGAKVVKSGDLSLSDDDSDVDVSTPLMRLARRREIGLQARRATVRRRRVLLATILGALVLLGTTIAGLTVWWAPLAGLGALLAWLVASRLSVMHLHRRLDAKLAEVVLGDEESTVLIQLEAPVTSPLTADDIEHSVEISAPIPGISLWDPIPVAATSYVQRPLAARTVRTIDLSAPVTAPVRQEPVTAGDDEVSEAGEGRRAVGE
ncbi:MAG TPA: hypothetical protein PKM36_08675 [Propionibacteriaceae bacterium]|nr:hypothetical protein [Propionibacteriaceae bacterium]HQE31721.1 hypothetical protein [Propionibacteriaceae bacterium]